MSFATLIVLKRPRATYHFTRVRVASFAADGLDLARLRRGQPLSWKAYGFETAADRLRVGDVVGDADGDAVENVTICSESIADAARKRRPSPFTCGGCACS